MPWKHQDWFTWSGFYYTQVDCLRGVCGVWFRRAAVSINSCKLTGISQYLKTHENESCGSNCIPDNCWLCVNSTDVTNYSFPLKGCTGHPYLGNFFAASLGKPAWASFQNKQKCRNLRVKLDCSLPAKSYSVELCTILSSRQTDYSWTDFICDIKYF